MQCKDCGKAIDHREKDSNYYEFAYQVRAVHEEGDEIVPDEDIGVYCGDCLPVLAEGARREKLLAEIRAEPYGSKRFQRT